MKTITLQIHVPDDTATATIDGHSLSPLTAQAWIAGLEPGAYIRQLTEKEITDQADGIAQRAYYSTVRGFAADLAEQIAAGDISDSDSAREYLEQSIDGCHDVIYTYAAQNVCRISPNDGAYFDDFGAEGMIDDSGIAWSRLAYCALLADVLEEIGDLDDFLAEHSPADPDDDDSDSETA